MDFTQIPIGLGMALARNAQAMAAYSAMSPQEKSKVLSRARAVRSEKEMRQLAVSIAANSL